MKRWRARGSSRSGFAMIGELGAIYFTVYNRKPFLAGLFFALAFGNRTEIVLTAPIFMFLLLQNQKPVEKIAESEADLTKSFKKISSKRKKKSNKKSVQNSRSKPTSDFKFEVSDLIFQIKSDPRRTIKILVRFCAFPFILGVSTLFYNYVRFQSLTDFGYARIPGVLNEPWYNQGIFSIYYIPRQAYEMLFKSWETYSGFPYLAPEPFSSSILWSSPFLLLSASIWRAR